MKKENARPRKAESSAADQRQLPVLHLHQSRGESRVDSRDLAYHLDIRHQHVRELIQDYVDDFRALGILRFETGEIRGRGQPEKYCLLNEDQCYLLLTYSRNTDRVRALKLRLVIAFRDARSRQALHDGVYLPSYHALHDEVAEMARRAHEAGSMAGDEVFHCNVNKLANKVCGLRAGERRSLNPTQQTILTATQEVIRASLRRSMSADDNHREAYRAAKKAAEEYAAMASRLLGGA
ncbi:Rha family transcriptional regulator [Burkholderia diffusa]|uniref:Rha family transcriptional regulator n=1 Tax=Burkholderia diffusa TaxID=488732 RepID=UPI00264D9CEE|nr:Rha family transcriptional regulator [Burkholderia diffusa]MDN7906232.1 Rha family transcriptional regulator [Burkholderia diffusa]